MYLEWRVPVVWLAVASGPTQSLQQGAVGDPRIRTRRLEPSAKRLAEASPEALACMTTGPEASRNTLDQLPQGHPQGELLNARQETVVGGVDLGDVLARLRDDIGRAMEGGDGQRIRFELGAVEITLSVTVASSGTGSAGVKFWVIEAGAEGSVSEEAVQVIKVTLTPKDVLTGTDATGTLGSPLIEGTSAPAESGLRSVRHQNE